MECRRQVATNTGDWLGRRSTVRGRLSAPGRVSSQVGLLRHILHDSFGSCLALGLGRRLPRASWHPNRSTKQGSKQVETFLCQPRDRFASTRPLEPRGLSLEARADRRNSFSARFCRRCASLRPRPPRQSHPSSYVERQRVNRVEFVIGSRIRRSSRKGIRPL